MPTRRPSTVAQDLRRSLLRRERAGLTDGELLEHYVAQRDEAAFEVLVRRHGPMVFGICRRILRGAADAEDAFQATFLVLVRKAASVRPRALVGNWLFGVAHNTALKARAMNQRRRTKEQEAAARRSPETPPENGRDLPALLDQELRALPAKHRAAIVLCELEGKSLKEAAHQLGCPPKTISTWLVRGRGRLAQRLARRGVTLPGGALAGLLGVDAASAGVPAPLLTSTIKTATLLAAGEALSAVTGAQVAALTEGVLKAMFVAKLKIPMALVLVVFVLAAGVGHLTYRAAVAGAQAEPPKQTARPGPAAPRAVEPIVQELRLPPEVLGIEFRFSPDGKKVVYIADRAMRELAVLDLTTNTTTKIVEAVFVQDLVWSPKGDHVAFHHANTREENSIRAVPASGGPPRTIVSPPGLDAFPFGWSKDGQWMLAGFYKRDRSGGSLMLVPVGGGEPRQLLSQVRRAKLSPDGQAVAYSRPKDGRQSGVFLFVLASQREIPVASGNQPIWSHDGRYLLFLRPRGNARDLWAQRIKDQVPAGEPLVVKQDMPSYSQEIDGSRYQVLDDGRLMYWTKTDVPVHLYAAALDPETGQVRGKPSVFAPRMEFWRPILSPDGQWLAGRRAPSELWVSKVDGTEARNVATDIRNPFEYGWFPDGKSVLTGGYIGEGRGKRGLFRIDVGTGRTETLYTTDQSTSNARLSPDGQRIAFGMRTGDGPLYVMKAEPNAQPVLLRRDSAEVSENPAWSPDGRSIAFIGRTQQTELSRLLVIPAAGGEPKELVGQTRASLSFPLWSPDGKFIVYSRVADFRPDTQPEIWLVRAAGGPPIHLRELDGYLPQTDSCLWSADGKSLLFKGQTERPKISVWSMTNYLPVD